MSLILEQGFDWMRQAARETHTGRNKIMFVDNGGSAGISSHLAIDYSKNGELRATAFNDPAALTCLGNDLGYDPGVRQAARIAPALCGFVGRDKQPGTLRQHP